MSSTGTGLPGSLALAFDRISGAEGNMVLVGGDKTNFTQYERLVATGRVHFWFHGTSPAKKLPGDTRVVFVLKWVEPEARSAVERQIDSKILMINLDAATGQFNNWSKRVLDAWKELADSQRQNAESTPPRVAPTFDGSPGLQQIWRDTAGAAELVKEAVKELQDRVAELGEGFEGRIRQVTDVAAKAGAKSEALGQENRAKDVQINELAATLTRVEGELRIARQTITTQKGEIDSLQQKLLRYERLESAHPAVRQLREGLEALDRAHNTR